MDNSITPHPDTFAYWKERALAAADRIGKENYYPSIWGHVTKDFEAAKTKFDLLGPFQEFWEALPDSPAIRRGVFFEICELAEEYCFGDPPNAAAAAETVRQVTQVRPDVTIHGTTTGSLPSTTQSSAMNREQVALEIVNATHFLANLPGAVSSHLVGSAAWKDDPEDIDFVVTTNEAIDVFTFLLDQDWESCDKIGVYEMEGNWYAVRKGKINLLLTEDLAWAERMVRATEVCKYLRLHDKKDRIAVNQIIRDGKRAEQFPASDAGEDLLGPRR